VKATHQSSFIFAEQIWLFTERRRKHKFGSTDVAIWYRYLWHLPRAGSMTCVGWSVGAWVGGEKGEKQLLGGQAML
jgi:hypothetical protein